MKPKQAYMKVVEWSEADGCYIGSAPPLVGPCCHGDTKEEVCQQLAAIVPDVIATYHEKGFKLPEASGGKEYSSAPRDSSRIAEPHDDEREEP